MSSRTPVWLVLWSLALFTTALLLNTRSNTFPYFYHPDESEKAAQLLTGHWNFHHPMLLLTTTKMAVDAGHVPPREQSVVEVGRWISAVFAAAAIVALSLLAYAWRGWLPCIGCGLTLLLHHQVFELSHYLKEDTALLFGVAFTFLIAHLYWQRPSMTLAVALGVASACAISGKYVGAFVLAVAVPVLCRASESDRAMSDGGFSGRKMRAILAGLALLATLLVINAPMTMHPGAFSQSFDRELQLAVHGQSGTTRSVPHALYWNIFRDNSTPIIWVLLAAFLFGRWHERQSVTLAEWLIIAFPFIYTLALSFSPKSNDRYFLPATGVLMVLAACGARDAARLVRRWIPMRWALPVLILALVAGQWPKWQRYDEAFAHDDNRELFEWVKKNLPPDAIIAKDSRVQLPSQENSRVSALFGELSQTVHAKKFAADLGTIRELRKFGVTHIAVSESDYGRLFLLGLRPKKENEDEFDRRRSFYKKLLHEGDLLFNRERGTVLYLHPGLRLYKIPPPEE